MPLPCYDILSDFNEVETGFCRTSGMISVHTSVCVEWELEQLQRKLGEQGGLRRYQEKLGRLQGELGGLRRSWEGARGTQPKQ